MIFLKNFNAFPYTIFMRTIAIKCKRKIKWCFRGTENKKCTFLSSSGYFDFDSGCFYKCSLEDVKEIGPDYFDTLYLPENCIMDVNRNKKIDILESLPNKE